MDNSLFGIHDLDRYLVLGILILYSLCETAAGYLSRSMRKQGDWIQEIVSFFVLSLLIKPGIVVAVLAIGRLLFADEPKEKTRQSVNL